MSRQLDQYLQMRADGKSQAEAAIAIGMTRVESDLTEKAIAGGHLSLPVKGRSNMSGGNVAAEQLRLFIERIERLEEEKKGIADDVKDVYAEAKSNGYDTKTVKRLIKLRGMEPHKRQEAEALLQTYMDAIGMTPIEAAIALAA
jgi:uncharacterized protein (UPF0335 family)